MRKFKKIAVTSIAAGAMGATALGLGAGLAQAEHDDYWVPVPGIPHVDFQAPPGQIGHVTGIPPGQFKKLPGPFNGVPPGHWDDVRLPHFPGHIGR
jgi:hypothetical protein